MGIWNDCAEHNAWPYYGYPIRVEVRGEFIYFEFPKLYPSMADFIDKVERTCGPVCETTPQRVVAKMDPVKVARAIYETFLD